MGENKLSKIMIRKERKEDYKKTDIYEGQVIITRENISLIEKFQVEGRSLRQAIIDKYEE